MEKVITKVYSCKGCGITVMLDSFTDEKTTLAMIEKNPYCDGCEDQLKFFIFNHN